MILTVAKIVVPIVIAIVWGITDRAKRLLAMIRRHPSLAREAFGTPSMAEDVLLAILINRYAYKVFTGYAKITMIERALNNSAGVKSNA